ncbi:MAG: hypothetical protein HRT72_05155 [Flavobacteriales bacterium]|nr:hypothetical protein [Flavobacteriales bacterium]
MIGKLNSIIILVLIASILVGCSSNDSELEAKSFYKDEIESIDLHLLSNHRMYKRGSAYVFASIDYNDEYFVLYKDSCEKFLKNKKHVDSQQQLGTVILGVCDSVIPCFDDLKLVALNYKNTLIKDMIELQISQNTIVVIVRNSNSKTQQYLIKKNAIALGDSWYYYLSNGRQFDN